MAGSIHLTASGAWVNAQGEAGGQNQLQVCDFFMFSFVYKQYVLFMVDIRSVTSYPKV